MHTRCSAMTRSARSTTAMARQDSRHGLMHFLGRRQRAPAPDFDDAQPGGASGSAMTSFGWWLRRIVADFLIVAFAVLQGAGPGMGGMGGEYSNPFDIFESFFGGGMGGGMGGMGGMGGNMRNRPIKGEDER